MSTFARAATTREMTDAGPRTTTSVGLTAMVPTSRPAGALPRSTWTGTTLVASRSRSIVTVAGSMPATVIRGSTERTWTLTLCGPLPGSMSARSTHASKSALIGLIPAGDT